MYVCVCKTHNTLDEWSLCIFRLDWVHGHITFCNILRDEPTQLRIYVVGAKIIAFSALIAILLCWSSAVRIPIAYCLQCPDTLPTMITTNNIFTLSCNRLSQNYFFPRKMQSNLAMNHQCLREYGGWQQTLLSRKAGLLQVKTFYEALTYCLNWGKIF